MCISTAGGLSQPQLDNYCLHEREREAWTGAVLCPLPSPPPASPHKSASQEADAPLLRLLRLLRGVSQWLLETRQSLCPHTGTGATGGVQSHTLTLDWPGQPWLSHNQNIDTTPHHQAARGEIKGFTDLMGSPLSSVHASPTTPPPPPSPPRTFVGRSDLLCSLKWTFNAFVFI